jgi:hypothetical protein
MPTPKLSVPSSTPGSSRTAGIVATTLPARGESISTRRAGHGSHPWSLPFSALQKMNLQPQDGSTSHASKLASIASRLHSNLAHEPEDARLTGGTRSLTRRLLGLNITSTARKAPQSMELQNGMPVITRVA